MSHPHPLSAADPEIVEKVIALFGSLYPVSPALKKDMYKHAFQLQLKKNAFLLKEGMICEGMYFVYKGIVRGFSTKRNKELTTWISVDGEFVSSISGLYGKVSKEGMQALEPTVLVGVPITVLLQWYDRFPEMNIIIRKVLEVYYQDAQERSYIIRVGTASEKYNYFAETRPGHIDRVPSDYIASFLGMTKETLEKIRNKKNRSVNDGTMEQLVHTIEKNVLAKELFKIKGLSVPQLSALLSVPAHLLSYVFNEYYKKNFADFINGYRIRYVKQQLAKSQSWQKNKIEAIGLDAGFASRSTFFAAFRKQEGITPAAYASRLH